MKKNNISKSGGLKNSKKDKQKTNPETFTIDMPEVKDIPGQEHIRVPQFREMQDTTISSADEEGIGVVDDLNSNSNSTDSEEIVDRTPDVSSQEKRILKKSAGHPSTGESEDFNKMALDERDDDGELLNEKGIKQDRAGEDLDIPGSELDDNEEDIGEEDEENNLYSQSQRD
jgi:hypothetical protein